MTWVNLDDKMPEHPKVDGLSDGAFRLHVAGICYCNRHLTDGIVTVDRLTRLIPKYKKAYLDELLARMVWIEIADSSAYEIHDYLDWNKSREEVESRRAVRSESGKKGARSRWQMP